MRLRGFTFRANPGHVLYPALISFQASDSYDSGHIGFSISVRADIAGTGYTYLMNWLLFKNGGEELEGKIWNHLVAQVEATALLRRSVSMMESSNSMLLFILGLSSLPGLALGAVVGVITAAIRRGNVVRIVWDALLGGGVMVTLVVLFSLLPWPETVRNGVYSRDFPYPVEAAYLGAVVVPALLEVRVSTRKRETGRESPNRG